MLRDMHKTYMYECSAECRAILLLQGQAKLPR